MSLATPSKIRELQIKLYRKAKNDCGGVTRCNRAAPAASPMKWCSVNWACSNCVRFTWGPVRESTVKPVGKPDAGNLHVRFDERGWETGRRSASVLAPILDSTRALTGQI